MALLLVYSITRARFFASNTSRTETLRETSSSKQNALGLFERKGRILDGIGIENTFRKLGFINNLKQRLFALTKLIVLCFENFDIVFYRICCCHGENIPD